MNLKFTQTLQTLLTSKESQIPQFSYQIIAQVKEELKRLNEQTKKQNQKNKNSNIQTTAQQKAFAKGKMALLLDQIYRIKRFLMIYYNFRCTRIQDQYWYYGGDLHHTQKGNISEQQKNYFGNYKSLVVEYAQNIGVDLTLDLQPPLQTQVQFVMLRDCGQILNQSGNLIKMQKDVSYFMKKRLVEPYVRQGYAIIKKN